MQTKPFLVVTGPTASGKSNLAIELAKNLNGEVVNIDSVQVYKDFNIGTAKILPQDRREIPHHLIDFLDPDKQFNAGEFIDQAVLVRKDLEKRGKLPIFCGGSTMYITHLIHGLAPLPKSDHNLRGKLEILSSDELYQKLVDLDPKSAAKLHRNDRIRVTRALEAILISGSTLSQILDDHSYSKETANPGLIIIVCWPREELYDRINRRSEDMVREGLVDETSAIISRFGRELSALGTLGYKQACDVIDGKLDKSKLAAEIALHTRHFAKRQMTYFRNEPAKRGWLVRPTEDEKGIELVNQPSISSMKDLKHFRACELSIADLQQCIADRFSRQLTKPEAWLISGRTL